MSQKEIVRIRVTVKWRIRRAKNKLEEGLKKRWLKWHKEGRIKKKMADMDISKIGCKDSTII